MALTAIIELLNLEKIYMLGEFPVHALYGVLQNLSQ